MTPEADPDENSRFECRVAVPRNPEFNRICYQALTRFWLRLGGWTDLLRIAGSIVVGVAGLRDTGPPFLFWLGLVTLVLGVLAGYQWVASYFRLRRRWFGRKEPDPIDTELGFSSAGLTIFREAESATLSWDRFMYLWQFPDCWVLVAAVDVFTPLPTSLLDEETKRFIADQFHQHGGRVKTNPGLGVGIRWLQKVF